VLRAGIERNQLTMIEADSFTGAVDERMRIYRELAGSQPIKCYINIGGGATSVGKSLGKKQLHSGLLRRLPRRARDIDAVMTRFLAEGVPVIHLIRVTAMAKRYGLQSDPHVPVVVGQGEVLQRSQYNNWYASGVLAVLLGGLVLVSRRAGISAAHPPLAPHPGHQSAKNSS
jgi:hypothetical protein